MTDFFGYMVYGTDQGRVLRELQEIEETMTKGMFHGITTREIHEELERRKGEERCIALSDLLEALEEVKVACNKPELMIELNGLLEQPTYGDTMLTPWEIFRIELLGHTTAIAALVKEAEG